MTRIDQEKRAKERIMDNLARKLEEEAVYQTMGTVVRVEGEIFVVQTERGELRARRATSCLVKPELHDFALVAGQGRAVYLLAILERESPNAILAADGDLDLHLPAGRMRIAAKEGIDLVSSKNVNLMGDQVGIHANAAKLIANEIVAIGSKVIGELADIHLRGTLFDKVFERVSERVKRSFRRVEEFDQLRAKQLDYSTEETMSLRSANMVATAKELVKVDGEQIHFG
jgi:hypothetical protein